MMQLVAQQRDALFGAAALRILHKRLLVRRQRAKRRVVLGEQSRLFHDALAALFYKIAACGAESLPDALFLRSCTDRILCTLLRLAEKPKNPVADVSAHAAMLGDIREYIQGHYGEPLPLSVLSQRAALSSVYFHRLFTACYGITPAQYTLTVRLNAAKQQLLAGDDTVAGIAQACGFSSQSYFNYKFKEQVGMSPLQYRKKMLSKIDL